MNAVIRPMLLTLAVAGAVPAAAQSNEELLKELRDLKARVTELEARLAAKEAAAPDAAATAPSEAQWGMTPEQAAELGRVSAKVEAMDENVVSSGFAGLKISGYIEPVVLWNQRLNRLGFQFLNQQSDGYGYDTSYMGSAVLDITKETESGTVWKLTLSPNRGAGAAIDGASIVQEASVTVPMDGGLSLIAGQVPDWSGYEYQQPTLNPLTSHNLLYDFTLPVAYTGVGLSGDAGPWAWKAMLANINATIRPSNDRAPSLVFRFDNELSEYAGIGFAGLIGKTANFNTGTSTRTLLLEVDGYHTRGDWTLQGQFGIGRQADGAITPDADGQWRDSSWWGVSGLVGYAFTPRTQGLLRADYLRNADNGGGLLGYNGYTYQDEFGDWVYGNDDRNGVGPDLAGDLNRGANRYAVTLGVKHLLATDTTLKFEYRFDGADRPVFLDLRSGQYHRNNQQLAASIVVAF